MILVEPCPPQVDRWERRGWLIGGIGLLLCLLGLLTSGEQFFRSYLLAYLYVVGLGVGCLCIVMIHHLSGGMWGLAIRRLLEAGARTLFFAPLLFLPLLLGMRSVYPWADPRAAAEDEGLRRLLEHKGLYLNVPFFLGRAIFYFAVWAVLAHFLSKWSAELDQGANLTAARRLRGLSGGGLLLMGLTITFASVDWGMSLDPRWFSTIYGILFMVGQSLSALSFVILLLALLGGEPPLSRILHAETIHDLGKLLFAFTMLWAYVELSQFLIIWSGNLPEEITFYLRRLGGGWGWLGLFVVLFHFVLPFVLLLSRNLKRNPRLLGTVAAWMLVARFVDLFWLLAPDFHEAFSLHWLDLAAPVALLGVFVGLFASQLKTRPLLPMGEPEIQERLSALEAS